MEYINAQPRVVNLNLFRMSEEEKKEQEVEEKPEEEASAEPKKVCLGICIWDFGLLTLLESPKSQKSPGNNKS